MFKHQAAAQGAVQVDGRVQALCLQPGDLLIQLQQRSLRSQHIELCAQAGALARLRQVPGGIGRSERAS